MERAQELCETIPNLSPEERIYILNHIFGSDHPAPPTKESVVIPEMNETSLFAEREWLSKVLYLALCHSLDLVDCITVDGNTQSGGKKLEEQIEDFLNSRNIPFKKAGSQQPIDFREVQFMCNSKQMFFESKKTDGTTIVLNDSIPKRGSWYVVYSTSYKKLIIILADVLLERGEGLQEYKRLTECVRHDFKSLGDFNACSRMNLSIDLRRYFDSNQSMFWDIREDPPPDLTEEKKKQKEKEKAAKKKEKVAKQLEAAEKKKQRAAVKLAKEKEKAAKQLAAEAKKTCRMGLDWRLFQ